MKLKEALQILEYPFDSEIIMRKQKSLKKALLAREDVVYVKKRIAILGGSTVDDIKNILELFLLKDGIEPKFYQSEYNKYYEDAIFLNEKMDEFRPEIIVIYTSIANFLEVPDVQDDSIAIAGKLNAEYSRFEKMWKLLDEKYHAVIIQNNFELPWMRTLGSFDAAAIYGTRHYIDMLNEKFAEYASSHANFCIHDIHYLSAVVGLDRWHDRFQYYAYKLIPGYDVIPEVSASLEKVIRAQLGYVKKCLVLDLDNTLWGGIIGDDGVENLQIGHETPAAEAYTEFQQYVKALHARGILLAVCSKNEDDVAKSGFNHPDSVLSVDDFTAFHANWEPKDQNIREIAHEINIGLDSLVFIDDNPVEREIVRCSLPEVSVPEVDVNDVSSYIRAIEGNGYFDIASLGKDDFQRNAAYQGNRKRHELEESVGSYDDFLKSLDMHAEIGAFLPVYYDRIAQLTNKSNQFNLTTRRYTRAEIALMASDDKYITLYGRLSDKFGDNGLIAVVIGEKNSTNLNIVLWLMSCRVLKRGMEQAMLDALVAEAKKQGIIQLTGYYYHTKKNKMVSNLYEIFGFTKQSQIDEDSVWVLDISNEWKRRNQFISVEDGK